jgi:hypothetical protein
LRRIPNFKFEFTDDQLSMINSKSKRTLIIGRSGTGKSTCAILRMLAIDLLFIGKKVIKSKRHRVEASDMAPTGIKTLFLTSSRVLADDLRVFYENMWTALKTKLLGKEMTKKTSVKKVLEAVEQMELDPDSFITNLGVNHNQSQDQSLELVNNDLKLDSTEGFLLINEESLKITENKKTFENSLEELLEKEDEEDYDDFEMSQEDANGVVLDNNKILEMMKDTFEQIEQKLEDYNFRGESKEQQIDNQNSKYPMFTTVLDFY